MAELQHLDLPKAIVESYQKRGIKSLYGWQSECLSTAGVQEGRNLVYCAPTSGGKTMVSEILMLQRLFKLKKRAIFVLPYVSVVTEKANFLQSLCKSTGALIKAFFGGSPTGIKEPFDIAVCTIEKANTLINYLVEEGQLSMVGTLVIDELHLVGDSSRGYLLEVFVSKVLFLAPDIQVVGLSATLPNVEDIARWLSAILYQTTYRPVPLHEYVLSGRQLLNTDGSQARELSFEGLAEEDNLLAATWEVTRAGHSVLIFCSSKAKCERTAESLAQKLPAQSRPPERELLVQQLQRQIGGADATLVKTMPAGIAFHHSGLTSEERSLVEKGYKDGSINVICATSTLAAGVNLPARRVLFQSPYMGNQLLDATQYKQMAGRAGRAGQGSIGESMIIAPGHTKSQVMALVRQELPAVSSCLRNEARGVKRLLLEVLCVVPQLGAGEDLIRFMASTLLMTQKPPVDERLAPAAPAERYPEIAQAMKWLLEHDMARLDQRSNSYKATPLGLAVCASALEPQQGHVLFQELQRSRSCISLDTDLQVCYLVTPDSPLSVDWATYRRVLCHLSSAERRVAQRIALRVDLVDQAQFQGRLSNSILQSADGMRVVRFYSGLVLWALLHETPLAKLLERFGLSKGQLQQLQQAAASFTHTVAVFCNRLQWYTLEALILSFQKRLALGVRMELVPLMQIPGMDCSVARCLYEQGFTTPVSVASARPPELLRVLRKTLPHHVPSAALPEENATRLIEAAAGLSKALIKEKRKRARAEPNEDELGLTTGQPQKRPRQAAAQAQSTTSASLRSRGAPSGVVQQERTSQSLPQTTQQRAPQAPLQGIPPSQQACLREYAQVQQRQQQQAQLGMPQVLQQYPHGMLQAQQQASPLAFPAAQAKRTLPPVTEQPSPGMQQVAKLTSPPPQTPRARARYQELSDALSPGGQTPDASLSRCATPCRAIDTPAEETSPLSSERLSEGLRRVGRQSLSPGDVEAGRSPGAESGVTSGGGSPGQTADSHSDSSHAAAQSEAKFLASTFAAGARLPLPPLQLLTTADPMVRHVLARVSSAEWIGASVVAGENGEDALCLTLGPMEAFCILLPKPDAGNFGVLGSIWSWFKEEQNLCLTSNAKDLAAAFLRRGMDLQCSLAEPRVAQWLLDPDDKQNMSISDLASACQVALASNKVALTNSGALASSPVLRVRLGKEWPEAFLALPLLADLLQRLKRQELLGSFWCIEMPTAVILAWMEHVGFGCEGHDPNHTHSHIWYKMSAIQEHVKKAVGRQVLLSSSEDVGRALFEDLRLPIPRGVQLRRKPNGRLCYKSPQDVLKRLLPNQTVALILEHRQLSHAAKRIENILRSAEPPRAEPLCPMCAAGTMGLAGPGLASRQRIRSEFVQTATATGRLATAAGAAPLLCLEKAFEICEVSRPSLHEELSKGTQVAAGTRVFVSAAFEPPPRRRLREGAIHEVSERTCDQPMANSEEDVSLADYWASRGWEVYKEESWRRSVQQVLVRHGNSVWSYPADQVWRLAAAVDVAEEDARKVLVNPRQLLAAEPGYVLLSLDYSQIEVRLMAHFSEDPRLLNILRNGGDVFKQIAAGWLGKDSSQVSAEERSGAKRICYSLIYGVGVARLAAELGISRSQANEFKSSFMKEYAGVAIWIKACTDQARQQGFVETLHGRRRFLPGLASGSASERAHAERQAVNTACQASAADLMKAAMIGIHRRLKLLRSHDGRCTMAGRILLQIHDELILEVEELRLSEVRELVVSEMIRAGCDLKVPLQVHWKHGKSWGSLEP
ncbi:unnamed protein product [Effrenium voratum]|uniref:DNA-directed DNA polymerase n=1 Tax=Effrenium voratum TaxID=2562239 RepID=A0AA36NG45_9DINO|nr:unnamed protein product [Effrenium voratum]